MALQEQLEAKPEKNSAEGPEEEQMLRHLRGPTEAEEDDGNCPFSVTQSRRQWKRSNPKQTRRRLGRLFAVELHLPAALQKKHGSVSCGVVNKFIVFQPSIGFCCHGVTGKFIKITIPKRKEMLTLCEVVVYGLDGFDIQWIRR
ncbi:hypothetical protein NDU88_004537 [Pleurodeles waltl]|uniref:Uncharacterized protein n=1 Tax=Pleurodeles waltl TaxID=8319 RepID=A0AAV7V399_PLEWA|nr:hypothetical protein NDU88_004537 [Pleurodeles waltl]